MLAAVHSAALRAALQTDPRMLPDLHTYWASQLECTPAAHLCLALVLSSTPLTHFKWNVGVSGLLTAMFYSSLVVLCTCPGGRVLCATPWPYFVVGWPLCMALLLVWDVGCCYSYHSGLWKELASALHKQQPEDACLWVWSQAFRILASKSGG